MMDLIYDEKELFNKLRENGELFWYLIGLSLSSSSISKSENIVKIKLDKEGFGECQFIRLMSYVFVLMRNNVTCYEDNTYGKYVLVIKNKYFWKFLKNYVEPNIHQRRFKLFNNVPKQHLRYFLRGIYEGKGEAEIDYDFNMFTFFIYNTSPDFIINVNKILLEEGFTTITYKKQFYYLSFYDRRDIVKFYDLIYSDYCEGFYDKIKREKLKELVDLIKTKEEVVA